MHVYICQYLYLYLYLIYIYVPLSNLHICIPAASLRFRRSIKPTARAPTQPDFQLTNQNRSKRAIAPADITLDRRCRWLCTTQRLSTP